MAFLGGEGAVLPTLAHLNESARRLILQKLSISNLPETQQQKTAVTTPSAELKQTDKVDVPPATPSPLTRSSPPSL